VKPKWRVIHGFADNPTVSYPLSCNRRANGVVGGLNDDSAADVSWSDGYRPENIAPWEGTVHGATDDVFRYTVASDATRLIEGSSSRLRS
jgi:hypothetical protein